MIKKRVYLVEDKQGEHLSWFYLEPEDGFKSEEVRDDGKVAGPFRSADDARRFAAISKWRII